MTKALPERGRTEVAAHVNARSAVAADDARRCGLCDRALSAIDLRVPHHALRLVTCPACSWHRWSVDDRPADRVAVLAAVAGVEVPPGWPGTVPTATWER